MKKKSTVLFLLIQLYSTAQITFTENIASIIYNKCSSCHHAGGIAPLQFTNYESVKKYAGIISLAALDPKTKFMPPWMPDTKYSHFVDERVLTEQEIKAISTWIEEGMLQGNVAAEPDLPLFPKNKQLGKPDLTVSMKESFLHKGDNKDEYRVFVLSTNIKEPQAIAAIEIVPGNPKIAHHIILGLDTTQFADKLDAKDDAYGYEQYSGFGFYPTIDNWSGWVPGNKTRYFPDGIGNYILPNSKVLLQMHYGPSPIDAKDSTTINIYYSKKPVERFIKGWVLSPNDIVDGPFFIKANTKHTFRAKYKVVGDCSLISVTPHAHWLGKKWEAYAVHPNGDTTNLIRINDWDFNWQNFFGFSKLIKLEKGTIIYCNATYDNTERNYKNPNRPLKNVAWGESAKDEMFLFYFAYVDYKSGDENIEIANELNEFDVAYSLEKHSIILKYNLAENALVNLKLVDDKNKTIQTKNYQVIEKGKHETLLNVENFKAGSYWCKISTENYTASKKIEIN